MHNIRKLTLWGNLMAGGTGVEYYFGYLVPETDLNPQNWRSRDKSWEYASIAIDFFQKNDIPFWNMKTDNALVGNPDNNNTVFAFAQPGVAYVVYLPEGGSTTLDLSNVKGKFEVKWYDPRNGEELQN